jgi:hypothetical protein
LGALSLGSPIGVFVLLLALPAWGIGRWVDSYKRRSVLFYDLDEDAAKAYEVVTKAFDEMMSCAGKWHIEAAGAVHDIATWKRNAGAGNLLKRKSAGLAYAAPKVIASNITPPSAQFGRRSVYFFPDAAFVIDGKQVGAISYDSFNIQIGATRFIEEETVPGDAKVIDHTWKHPNKKGGGPDRRFSDNYQIPVCLYEAALFSSSSGLNEMLEFSRTGVVAPFENAIKALSLQLGGQATPEMQSSATVELAREPKSEAASVALQKNSNSIQKAHQMLLDTKADFFRRFKEASDLSDSLVEFRKSVLENFDSFIQLFLCTVASADGPINAKEAEVINLLLGVQQNEVFYNRLLETTKDIDITNAFEQISDVAIQLGGIEQGTKYDPKSDPVAKCVETLGLAVLLADGDVNQNELASLSNFTAIAQSKATEIARRIQSKT